MVVVWCDDDFSRRYRLFLVLIYLQLTVNDDELYYYDC